MRTIVYVGCIAMAIVYPTSARAQRLDTASIVGRWEGEARRAGVTMRMAVDVRADSGRYLGTVDIPEHAFLREPVLNVIRVSGDSVRFATGLSLGALSFRGLRRGGELTGQLVEVGLVNGAWTAVGDTGTFSLRRVPAVRNAFREVAVRFASGRDTLAGTIVLPERGVGLPGAVFVHGSGPVTRAAGLFYAAELARAGVATLIYDKRGVGRSQGSFDSTTFDALTEDAIAAAGALREYPDVDDRRIGFIGISQAGWLIPRAAARTNAAFVILLSAPAVPVWQEDLWDAEVRLRDARIPAADSLRAIELLLADQAVSRTGRGWEALQRRVESVKDSAWWKTLGRTLEPPSALGRRTYGASLDYDPLPDVRALTIPGLWLFGVDDESVPAVESARRIRELCRAGKDFTVIELAGSDHALRRSISADGRRGLPHIAPEALPALHQWLRVYVNPAVSPRPTPNRC